MFNLKRLLFLILLPFVSFALDDSKIRQRKGSYLTNTTNIRNNKPNIVLILTDDQDVELGSLNFMKKTLETVRDHGAEFRHAYVTTPMCCPSRSSLLTGMYVHNHHVYTNNDNCSSTQWQTLHETRSFATYLSNAGYRTGYFGKYLNKYNGSYIPPGWREWGGLIMNSKYYNYSINMNGKKIKHGFDYQKDYYSNVIANDSIAFLRQSKKNNAHKPVMLVMSFPAPHGPEDSAPQYSNLFFNITTHHTPSYDYAPNPDKQWILQVTKKMEPIHKEFTNLLMTKRLQTLQSVDDAVQAVINELDSLGELDNTYVIYTSDHGYHLGQFGLIKGKSFPFEFDVRVPFLVRGPGIEPGTINDDIVLNIDLAPTFLDMAGVEIPSHMDGRSIMPLLLNSKRKHLRWPDTFLIESSGRRETPYLDALKKKEITIKDNSYLETSTAKILENINDSTTTIETINNYDSIDELNLNDNENNDEEVVNDDGMEGYENENMPEINSRNGVKDSLLLFNYKSNVYPLIQNKFERLAVECLQKEMQFPCQPTQKWYCINDNGRWRKHKCKSIAKYSNANNVTPTYKKCACFTSTGLVYRKIPNMPKKDFNSSHLQKPTSSNNLFIDRMINDPNRYYQRQKRNSLAHIENVMRDFMVKLNGLEDYENSTVSKEYVLKNEDQPNVSSKIETGCTVVEDSKVNCSKLIYHDRKSWRQSRHQIDNEIYELKQKLEKLKEIRRHLKHSKPFDHHNRIYTNEFNELLSSTNTNLSSKDPSQINETNSRIFKRKQKLNLQHHNNGNLNKPLNSSLNPNINSSPSQNPLRHTHKLFTSVTLPQNFDNYPMKGRNSTNIVKQKNENSILPHSRGRYSGNNYCHCETEDTFKLQDVNEIVREVRRKSKEEKLRRKLRKQHKKDQMEKECLSERMNCFHHDNSHWKTAPLWNNGPFCFCMNANNNTYSCIRTINSTHNFLYCEFTTGLITFYNLRIDPYELQNRIEQLTNEERSYLHNQLNILMGCKGRMCTIYNRPLSSKLNGNVLSHYVTSSPRYKFRKRKLIRQQSQTERLGLQNNAKVNNSTVLKERIVRRRRKSH